MSMKQFGEVFVYAFLYIFFYNPFDITKQLTEKISCKSFPKVLIAFLC